MTTVLQSQVNNPSAAGLWPTDRSQILNWLVLQTSSERFIDNIFVEMCTRLLTAGVPVARATLHFWTHHPQWLGARILWRTGMIEAKINRFAYDEEKTEKFRNHPANQIYQGVPSVRKLLEVEDSDSQFPFYDELRSEGMTDYIAWPVQHTLGKRHTVSFATDRAGGFTDADLVTLCDLLPPLALVTEIRIKNVLARTLLQTYVGPHASEQILAGATTRGSGVTLGAAIMIYDLRDFTKISDLWPRDDVIEMLNGYFDAISEPIENHGGEILKLMGDGLLAVFPLDNPNACQDLLLAVDEARKSMMALNSKHRELGRPELRYGLGVHVGDVMYGNIGSTKRLDFTAIGPAVNIASRLEALTKDVGRSVLFSKEFVEMAHCPNGMESLGHFQLRALETATEVYALASV